MADSTACPPVTLLQQLLDGQLPTEERATVTAHLDGCPACQSALERLAAGHESWEATRQQLRTPPPVHESALQGAIEQLQDAPHRAETRAESGDGAAEVLDFLAPTTEPGHLGRLAHYEILEVVGRGGMGIVLKAFDPKLHRVVAIKVMAPLLASNVTARKRFVREARAAAGLTHEHIVTIHEINDDNNPPFLVMQYVAGRSLQQRIDECGALELKEILRIGLQTASGLAAAHAQGLVHRDIKPANILLENGIERVKITDFGLARAVDDARVTQSGVVTGTPQYMAPEQARGEAVDHRADLFSLGGVLYAMCTGYAPFRASSSMAVLKKVCEESPRAIRDLNPEIPDQVAAIGEKLLAKDPRDRVQSASELANLLGQHLAHIQQPAVFPRPPEIIRPLRKIAPSGPRRSLALPILLLVMPLILIPALILGGWFVLPPGGPSSVPPSWTLMLIVGPLVLLSAVMVVIGIILFIVRLARRPATAAPPLVLPVSDGMGPPRRSRAWVAALIVGISLAALLFCLLPVGILVTFYLWGSSPHDAQPKLEGVTFSGRPTELGQVEELVTIFGPGIELITKEIKGRRVAADDDSWQIASSDNTDYSNARDDLLPRVHLYQLARELEGPCRLTFRFQVRTENVQIAYFETRRVGNSNAPTIRGRTIQGSTSWTTYEISYDIVQGDRLNDPVALDLVVLNGSLPKSVVWIKYDVELVKTPLPIGPVVPFEKRP